MSKEVLFNLIKKFDNKYNSYMDLFEREGDIQSQGIALGFLDAKKEVEKEFKKNE